MQPQSLRIGLVEDDPIMGAAVAQRLGIEGHSVEWWQRGSDALASERLAQKDIVVCDLRLPDLNGEEVFRKTNLEGAAPPFLFVTGYGEIDQAVQLMRLGACDYITKPFEFSDFLSRLTRYARKTLEAEDGGAVLGVSRDMVEAERMLGRYARTQLPVLVTGETGVGKEVAARLLHRLSSSGPFMAVNCAAIPDQLLESEIFGHERGAFTDSVRRHLGYAERVEEGVLFLDEIGEMPPALQPKILRLVEEREFHRVGGEAPLAFRGRIVAATHRDLEADGGPSSFRADLFYRLSVLPVTIKPLRERPDDIPWLMRRLLSASADRQDRMPLGFTSAAEERALAHAWPGNVRELRNRIDRALALAEGDWIGSADLFPEAAPPAELPFASLADTRHAAEKRQIERALAETAGQMQAAAKLLGVSRTTLWEKITRLGILVE